MRIFITGQCTLHWGRMEFGNIGNYYIIEPFVRLIHETFPDAELVTTFQMSDRFCRDEKIRVLPMDLYYGWDNDLEKAEKELTIAKELSRTGIFKETTPYIKEVYKADLVIDFSGDIWGDNADFLGKDRFYVGLCKDRVAQLIAPKTVMLAGSPGPFDNKENLEFAKEVYSNFDLVTNREFISINLLNEYGFDTSKTYSLACPAFRFEPANIEEIINLPQVSDILNSNRPKIGFVICGWNFKKGPFDRWPRENSDYEIFVDAIEKFSNEVDADIYLMSHSNGFPIPPEEFQLQHGRDYPVIKQLQRVIEERGLAKNVYSLDGVYDAWQTKAIIGHFDMFVSGRVHAAVAALSQSIPTVIIDYGHEPKAHKLKGFAEVANALDYVANPDQTDDIFHKMNRCWNERDVYRSNLFSHIPKVKELAKQHFDLLKPLISN